MLANKARSHRHSPHAYSMARASGSNSAELAALRHRVEQLSHLLEQARERERRRIAREMHDSTVQDLVAIGLMLRRLQGMVVEPEACRILGDVRGVLARTQQDLRTLSYLMHPPMLDDQGLVVALRALIGGLASRMRMQVELACSMPGLRTSAEVENALYRVVQEALINTHKHASATRADVRYFREGGRLVLEVEDDGVGMECDDQTIGSGVGIQGMRARVEQLGGTLLVASGTSGVLIRAEFPVVETNWGYEPREQFLIPITPWGEGLS